MAAKKLSRGKKAWATRRKNTVKAKDRITLPHNQGLKVGDKVRMVIPHNYTIKDGPEMPFPSSIETTMIALERSIDSLIQRIEEQTKRIKGMM